MVGLPLLYPRLLASMAGGKRHPEAQDVAGMAPAKMPALAAALAVLFIVGGAVTIPANERSIFSSLDWALKWDPIPLEPSRPLQVSAKRSPNT